MYEVDTRELKIAMAEAEISTIEELSKAANVNRNTTAGVVNGSIYPSSMVMSKLAAAKFAWGASRGRFPELVESRCVIRLIPHGVKLLSVE